MDTHSKGPINLAILKAEDAGSFWAKELPSEYMTKEALAYIELAEEMNNYYNNTETFSQPVTPKHGKVFIGRNPNDKRWYRAKVENILMTSHGTVAVCFLVDLADNVNIPSRWIREALEVFLKLPWQAKRYILYGVQPITLVTSYLDMTTVNVPSTTWDTSANEFVMKLVKESTCFTAELFGEDQNKNLQIRLYLRLPSGNVCLNDRLVEDEYAVSTVQTKRRQKGVPPVTRVQLPLLSQEEEGSSEVETSDAELRDNYKKYLSVFDKDKGQTPAQSESDTDESSLIQDSLPGGPSSASQGRDYFGAGDELVRQIQSRLFAVPDSDDYLSSDSVTSSLPESKPIPTASPLRAENTTHSNPPAAVNTTHPSPPRGEIATHPSLSRGETETLPSPPQPLGRGIAKLQQLIVNPGTNRSHDEKMAPPVEGQFSDSADSKPTPSGPVSRLGLLMGLMSDSDATSDKNSVKLYKGKEQPFSKDAEAKNGSVASAQTSRAIGGKGRKSRIDTLRKAVEEMENQEDGDESLSTASDLSQQPGLPSAVDPVLLSAGPTRARLPAVAFAGSKKPAVTAKTGLPGAVDAGLGKGDGAEVGAAVSPGLRQLSSGAGSGEASGQLSSSESSESFISSRGTGQLQRGSDSLGALNISRDKYQRRNVTFSDSEDTLGPRSGSESFGPPKSILKKSSSERVPDTGLDDSLLMKLDENSTQGMVPGRHSLDSYRPAESNRGIQPAARGRQQRHQAEARKPARMSDPGSLFRAKTGLTEDKELVEKDERKVLDKRRLSGKRLLRELNLQSSRTAFTRSSFGEQDEDPLEHGVYIANGIRFRPVTALNEARFNEFMKQRLLTIGFPQSSMFLIQAYCWPQILQGSHVIGIANRSGKTHAYLPPLLTELQYTTHYEGLPPGGSPIAVILCATWQKARHVYDCCRELVSGCTNSMRTKVVFGGGGENTYEVELINGCEILVATAPCLVRMLAKQCTSLKRLCHLIVDDAHTLTEKHTEHLKTIMEVYMNILKEEKNRMCPSQIVMMSSEWTPGMESFQQAYMHEPVVIVTTMLEAAVYTKVKQNVHMCEDEQRVRVLNELVDSSLSNKKVVIFTMDSKEASNIVKILESHSMYSLLAHSLLDASQMDRVRRDWNLARDAKQPRILVCTDEVFKELLIQDAEVIIHFDIPRSEKGTVTFGPRLSAMAKNFDANLCTVKQTDHVLCQSHLIFIRREFGLAPHLVHYLRRVGLPVDRKLQKLADGVKEGKEEKNQGPLCHSFKAFGKCWIPRKCKMRHRIMKELDQGEPEPGRIRLPHSGEVKVLVTYIRDASCYFVRLIEHISTDGITTSFIKPHQQVFLELAMWYASPANRVQCEMVELGGMYAYEDIEHIYHRVHIVALPDVLKRRDKVEVRMVDQGGNSLVDPTKLYELPDKFKDIPFQAVEVFLCRLKPVDEDPVWTDQAGCKVHEMVVRKELFGRIVLSLGNTLWLDPLVLRNRTGGKEYTIQDTALRAELVRCGLAHENPKHVRWLYGACADDVEIPDSTVSAAPVRPFSLKGCPVLKDGACFPHDQSHVSVHVSAVDTPDCIYVQLQMATDMLETLMVDIDMHIRHRIHRDEDEEPEGLTLDTGTLVLAQFPLDEKWYRGQVLSVNADGSCEVFFVDYGDTERVDVRSIHPMPVQFFELPFQAIRCKLANVEPAGDSWSPESGDKLWELTQGADGFRRFLMAQVMCKEAPEDRASPQYTIRLYDTSHKFDIDISHELVAAGHARPTEDYVQNLIPVDMEAVSRGAQEYVQIPSLCATLVRSTDPEEQQTLAENIQNIIAKHAGFRDAIRDVGGVQAVCQAVKLTASVNVLEALAYCIIFLTLNNSRNSDMVCNEGAIQALVGRLYMSEDEKLQEYLVYTIQKLTTNPRVCDNLYHVDAIKTLLKVMAETKVTEIQQTCAQILQTLFKDHCSCEEVVKTECLSLMHDLLKSDDTTQQLQLLCLQLLLQLSLLPSLHERFQRNFLLKLLCQKLVSYKEKELFLCVRILINLLQTEDNKVFIPKNTPKELEELISGENMSTQLKTKCETLHGLMVKDPVIRPPVTVKSPARAHHPSVADRLFGKKPVTDVKEEKVKPPKEKIKGTRLFKDMPALEQEIQKVTPNVLWAQNVWKLRLSVNITGVTQEPSQVVQIARDALSFRATVDYKEYTFQLQLYELVDPEKSCVEVRANEVLVALQKEERSRWPRLVKQKVKPHFVQVDCENFIDSSSDDSDYENEEVSPFVLKKRKNILRYTPFTVPKEPSLVKDGGPDLDGSSSSSDENPQGETWDSEYFNL